MAQEKLSQAEHQSASPEALREAAEQRERIAELHEQQVEKSPEKNREQERAAAEKEAKEQAAAKETVRPAEKKPTQERRGAPSKRERTKAFDTTMSTIRKDMSAPARTFSKLIHAKPVEAASEAIGSTIARPNAIAMAGAFALLFTTVVYVVARYYGYQLSGFESIGSFVLGWVVGLIFDYIRSGFVGKNRGR